MDMERKIRDWFATHEDDQGDFFVATRDRPFSVIPPTAGIKEIMYCTKQHCLRRLLRDLGGQLHMAAVMRGGLPSSDDVEWLRGQVGSQRMLFLGDADPCDLLTYALLREHLPIDYVGVSDGLLLRCGVDLDESLTIQLVPPEIEALSLIVECLGDLESQLGPWCAGLLSLGRKIEMEALFSFANFPAVEIEAAILKRK